jgi:hypothetical protein
VQISIRAKLPKGKRATAALYQEAIRYRVEHGEDHPNFTTRIVRWRNSSRGGQLSAWRQGNQSDAWGTLGKWLTHSTVGATTVRRRPRGRKKP